MIKKNIFTFFISSVMASQLFATVDFDINNAKKIVLNNKSIEIKEEGTYLISGMLNDGNITIDVKDEQLVTLLLNGVEIKSKNSSAILIQNAKKTKIVSLEGSINKLSDSFENSSDATIFSKDDLEILGKGVLDLRSYKNDAIKVNDELLIDGNLLIKSNDDGIVARDYLEVKNGKINISAQGNGIKTTNEEKGEIFIKNGEINIESEHDGIQAITSLIIEDGEINISSLQADFIANEDNDSSKSMKAKNIIKVNGGRINLKSSDDGIHSNNEIEINGGIFNISSIDDAIHSDKILTINGGNIDIVDSYEGIESNIIKINDGYIKINSKDDALNAAGNSNPILYINSGNIEINSLGDGIDVNGDIVMSGGKVIVNGPVERRNSAIDYDDSFKITGGTFVAVGSAGMAQTASDTSTQNSILIELSPVVKAGSLIKIMSQNKEEILNFTPLKEAASIAFSSNKLEQNKDYSIFVDGELLKEFKTTGLITSDIKRKRHGKGKKDWWEFW